MSDGEAEEEATEGPSNEELKKEVEGILDSAGADFSMKDLLAKLRAFLFLLPTCHHCAWRVLLFSALEGVVVGHATVAASFGFVMWDIA